MVRPKYILSCAAYSFALSGFCLGILGSGIISAAGLPDGVRVFFTVIAVSSAAISATCGFYLLYLKFREDARNRKVSVFSLSTDACTDEEIELIARLAEDRFGQTASSLTRTKRLHSLDPYMFTAIFDGKRNLEGYICTFRLTMKGRQAIEKGEFSINHIPDDYIRVDPKHNYCDWYIGAAFGLTMPAKAMAIGTINGRIRGTKSRKVFARAASDDGLRVLLKHKFQPVLGKAEVGELFVLNRTSG